VPIYILPLLIWKRAKLAASPTSMLLKVGVSIFKSAMMLTAYIAAMKGTMCAARHFERKQGGAMHWLSGAVAGALTGPCVLWENQSRRSELAIYVAPQTAIVVWNKLVQWRWASPLPGFNTLIFATAMAAYMRYYVSRPESLKPWITAALSRVVEGPLLPSDTQALTPSTFDATGDAGIDTKHTHSSSSPGQDLSIVFAHSVSQMQ
jgi:hypothetical protein